MDDLPKQNLGGEYNFLIFGSVLLVLIAAILFGGVSLFTFTLKSDSFQFQTVLQILGPAVISALLVERAVEVIVVTWRKLGRTRLEQDIAALETGDTFSAEEKTSLATLKNDLIIYRDGTLKMAAGFTVFFSFLAALAGIRVLLPFFAIDPELMNCITGLNSIPEDCHSGIFVAREHFHWLVRLDVFLGTFVIAGGSSGLHSIVSAITRFADNSDGK